MRFALAMAAALMLTGCEGLELVYEPYPAPTERDRADSTPDPAPTDPNPDPRAGDPTPDEPAAPVEPTKPVVRSDAPDRVDETPASVVNDRAFAMFTAAGGEDRPDRLHFVPLIWDRGWDVYISRVVQPEIDRGFRRLVVVKACGMQPAPSSDESTWNVVGQRAKNGKQIRSRALTLSQLEQHRPDLASTFVSSWSKVGAQVDELMIYIGVPAPQATQEEVEAWVEPFMSIPNVSFGLDSLGAIEPDSAGGRLLTYLMAEGKRVYVEPVMPKDEWAHWPRTNRHFAATVIDSRFDIMLEQDRWHRASEVGDELVVLVQGRGGEDAQGRVKRIGEYLRKAEPNRVSVAFGTRGMSEIEVQGLLNLARR